MISQVSLRALLMQNRACLMTLGQILNANAGINLSYPRFKRL